MPFLTRYMRSMYTIFSAEFAYTVKENAFGVFATLVVGFIYGGLAGVLSSIMQTQSVGQQEQMLRHIQIKGWMRSRNMKRHYAAKILAFFIAEEQAGTHDEQAILASLPNALAHEVSYDLYSRYISNIPMFRSLGKEVVNHICRLVNTTIILKDMVVYESGFIGSELYFITKGEIEVTVAGETAKPSTRSDFACTL
eukprot:SAG22_NODE_879_length_6707_cov_14.725787_6_plen_196_part_00